jgi:hypothetical protein
MKVRKIGLTAILVMILLVAQACAHPGNPGHDPTYQAPSQEGYTPDYLHAIHLCNGSYKVAGNDTGISAAFKSKGILQIENAKSNLTDAQKKLSTDLLQLLNSGIHPYRQNGEALETRMKRLKQFRPANDDRVVGDLVYVYVHLESLAGTQTIEPYVWEITDMDEENHLAVAWVEVNDLETLASLAEVRTIRGYAAAYEGRISYHRRRCDSSHL